MTIQYIFEILGVVFFSISGALVSGKKTDIDWFGAVMVSFVTALGGGTIRDIFLGSYPLVWVKDITYLYAVFAGIILTKLFHRSLSKLRKEFFLFDTLGLGFFTVLGTEKALSLGTSDVIAVVMGTFTGVMGGVMRDVLTREFPIIFHKEIYATVCVIGASFYLLLEWLGCPRIINFIASATLIVIIRIIVVKKDMTLSKFIED